ncbi:HTH_Tnp_Tc3_2 domain-containing protein [Trichonephila clavipes]|nr:HTH_Tnp_Tc3_2 domain-containing protein [Trichonephila clavipes]
MGSMEYSVLRWKYQRNLELPKMSSLGFGQQFLDDGNDSRRYNTDRPRVAMPNEDRCLAITLKRNRQNRAPYLSSQPSAATGTTVSKQTLNTRLGHIDLYARRLLRYGPLTVSND